MADTSSLSQDVSTHDDSGQEKEEQLCPLCLEELDITDRNFRPCQCGYQVIYFSLSLSFLSSVVLSFSSFIDKVKRG